MPDEQPESRGEPAVTGADRQFANDVIDAMFETDIAGRLVGSAPHLHVLRTSSDVVCRTHAALSDDVAGALRHIAERPRLRAGEWSRDYADYAEALFRFAPIRKVRAGQLYAFRDWSARKGESVPVTTRNARVLENGLDEWLPDVEPGLPMTAALEGGQGVAVCASVFASRRVHGAGVETLPAFRGKGHGATAVSAWARIVIALGAAPIYATTFDNLASQELARALRLTLVGSESSISCRPS